MASEKNHKNVEPSTEKLFTEISFVPFVWFSHLLPKNKLRKPQKMHFSNELRACADTRPDLIDDCSSCRARISRNQLHSSWSASSRCIGCRNQTGSDSRFDSTGSRRGCRTNGSASGCAEKPPDGDGRRTTKATHRQRCRMSCPTTYSYCSTCSAIAVSYSSYYCRT